MHTLLILNPGHFHAALVLRERHPSLCDDIYVYSEPGPDLDRFLEIAESFNTRQVNPTQWKLHVYRGKDGLEKLIHEKKGDIAVLAGRNNTKMENINTLNRAGLAILADKPWVTTQAALPFLRSAMASDRPLAADIMTEISDNESSVAQIEVYNPRYSSIDFSDGFTFNSSSTGGELSGVWAIPSAVSGEYALFNVTTLGGLDPEGDTIGIYQNGMLIEEISYGQKGPIPDPLIGESVERVRGSHYYTDKWSRNWTSGPTFGAQNDVQPPILDSSIVLNEIMFNPSAVEDGIVELYLRPDVSLDISGYKIVGDPSQQVNLSPNEREIVIFVLEEYTEAQVETEDKVKTMFSNGSGQDSQRRTSNP